MVSTKVCRFFECLSNSLPRHRRQQCPGRTPSTSDLRLGQMKSTTNSQVGNVHSLNKKAKQDKCSVSVHRKSSLRVIAVVCAWRFSHHSRIECYGTQLPTDKL